MWWSPTSGRQLWTCHNYSPQCSMVTSHGSAIGRATTSIRPWSCPHRWTREPPSSDLPPKFDAKFWTKAVSRIWTSHSCCKTCKRAFSRVEMSIWSINLTSTPISFKIRMERRAQQTFLTFPASKSLNNSQTGWWNQKKIFSLILIIKIHP